MNPQATFCPNPACCARGQVGQGNIWVHSGQERRYRCTTCHKTFSETTGTAMYGIKKARTLKKSVQSTIEAQISPNQLVE
jgi:transposase-like protein